MADCLLMIYNADAGVVNGAIDMVHKMLRPETYDCRLCGVTYGLLGMKRAWAQTVAALPHPVVFLYRDELAGEQRFQAIALPAIVLERDGVVETVVSAADFEDIDALADLQALLLARLSPLGASA